ncbi:uncharacterized protein LOC125159130 [Prionailurus viverrinus]|uniref:uncharacterized protein LOC125159130 n=1 Tax=Prionailurus viverrinus TaxID=61388 RepID=UPI001FF6EFA4|nr:uncharacterized protein LOC125159130 [Prionailurus viverrinus]
MKGSDAWWAGHAHTPGQGWLGGTGCAGVALLSPRFIPSPAGGCHCVPGAGLCALRNQRMKSGGDCRNPASPALQRCACAPSPRRATLDPGREWPHGGLWKQGLEMAWEGLPHRPGPSTGSWLSGPGTRTRSPRSPRSLSPRSPGQERKPVRLQSPTQQPRGPRRLWRQGWRLERLLQGPGSQQVTWDLCRDSGRLGRVSWVLLLLLLLPLFLLLLPTPFLPPPFSPPLPPLFSLPLPPPPPPPLPPPLLPHGCQPLIKGLRAYTGCLFYF